MRRPDPAAERQRRQTACCVDSPCTLSLLTVHSACRRTWQCRIFATRVADQQKGHTQYPCKPRSQATQGRMLCVWSTDKTCARVSLTAICQGLAGSAAAHGCLLVCTRPTHLREFLVSAADKFVYLTLLCHSRQCLRLGFLKPASHCGIRIL